MCLPLSLYLSQWNELNSTHWIIVEVMISIMILQLISIAMQPASKTPVSFKVKIPINLMANVNDNKYLLILCLVSYEYLKFMFSLQVPLVPLTPALSIFINIYLMFFFDMYTWIKFIIWMIVG